jgi:hemerythrin-like domain-containing protein
MCEYCGCQAVTVIEELTREHERVLDHVRDAEQAARRGDLDAARAACERIEDVLVPHTAVEEHGLFPALEGEFPDQVRDLEQEHRHLEDVINRLHGPGAAWSGELLEVLSMLRQHILKEQDGVFPAALAMLREPDWQAMEDVRASVGSALTEAS